MYLQWSAVCVFTIIYLGAEQISPQSKQHMTVMTFWGQQAFFITPLDDGGIIFSGLPRFMLVRYLRNEWLNVCRIDMELLQ